MERAQKAEVVDWVKGVFDDNEVVVVVQNAGLTVSEMETLRTKLNASGASLKVVKNRLAKIAVAGKPGEKISGLFQGPTAISYSQDPVAAPKALAEFAKSNEKLVILGGVLGETALDEAGVKALATLPSLDELRGKLVGLLQAPAQKIASVLQAPGGQLARVFSAYGSKDEAA